MQTNDQWGIITNGPDQFDTYDCLILTCQADGRATGKELGVWCDCPAFLDGDKQSPCCAEICREYALLRPTLLPRQGEVGSRGQGEGAGGGGGGGGGGGRGLARTQKPLPTVSGSPILLLVGFVVWVGLGFNSKGSWIGTCPVNAHAHVSLRLPGTYLPLPWLG